MDSKISRRIVGLAIVLLHLASANVYAEAQKLVVFTTLPDWASLAEAVGGDEVDASSMVFGREDPHYSEPRPSFVKKLSLSDVFVTTGLEMDAAYTVPMVTNARNPRVMIGQPGSVVAATAIDPLRPQGNVVITRAMGDIHAAGNPHFNLDPLSGLAVAKLLSDRFSLLRPSKREYFEQRYDQFERRMGEMLVGEELHAKYNGNKLAQLAKHGRLESFLEKQDDLNRLGGWLGQMAEHRGTKVIDDHPMWQYFALLFGLDVAGSLEPVPGVPPSTAHIKLTVEKMRADDIRVVIKSPYYDPRFSRFIARETGAKVVELAHQVGALDGADDYLSMIDVNVRNLASALGTDE